MEINFCRRCGQALKQENSGYACANGHEIFVNPAPAMGVALVNGRKEVLLAVRGVDPGKGKLDLPGGFVESDETLEEATARELEEELGLSRDDYGPLQYVMSVLDPYPYGGETSMVLGVIYWAKLKPEVKIVVGDDVAGVVTVAAKDIDLDDLSSKGEQRALRRLMEMNVI